MALPLAAAESQDRILTYLRLQIVDKSTSG